MHYGLCENSEGCETIIMRNNVVKLVTQTARKKKSESHQQESNLCSSSFLSRHIWTSHRFDSVGGNLYFFFWAVSFLESNSSPPKIEMPVPSDLQYDPIQAIQFAFLLMAIYNDLLFHLCSDPLFHLLLGRLGHEDITVWAQFCAKVIT